MASRILTAIAILIFGMTPALARQEPAPKSADVQVLLIGSFHFRPSSSDVIATQAGDILGPQKQAELEDITNALMGFEPTVVAIEQITDAPDYTVDPYTNDMPDILTTQVGEGVQIGFRLAAKAGLEVVHGVDEQPGEGEPDYFPYGAVLEHLDKIGLREDHDAQVAAFRKALEAEQARVNAMHLAQALIEVNHGIFSSAEFYYKMLDYDQGEEQPGAVLNARWFMRNAKIFAKLMDVTEPGDRVVLIYGAGHVHWLKHLLENTPGYSYVDPADYLAKAVRKAP